MAPLNKSSFDLGKILLIIFYELGFYGEFLKGIDCVFGAWTIGSFVMRVDHTSTSISTIIIVIIYCIITFMRCNRKCILISLHNVNFGTLISTQTTGITIIF